MPPLRPLARAGALALAAATLAACGDSTGPLELSPDQFASLGESVALELESGVMQLAAQDAMNAAGTPALSLQARPVFVLGGGSRFDVRLAPGGAALALEPGTCGVPSQDPPADSDEDGVPDNFSITFSLPDCHIDDGSGFVMDMTGVLRLSDPQPGTAGLSLALALDELKVAFSGDGMNGWAMRDGSASVSASAGGLSQTQHWVESARVSGAPSIAATIDWMATFAAAAGQSLTAGAPLPDGSYSPNGTVKYREGDRVSGFEVTTVEPLQYSAACAAGIEGGTSVTPFTGGEVHLAFADDENAGIVRITYADCDYATVVFVGGAR